MCTAVHNAMLSTAIYGFVLSIVSAMRRMALILSLRIFPDGRLSTVCARASCSGVLDEGLSQIVYCRSAYNIVAIPGRASPSTPEQVVVPRRWNIPWALSNSAQGAHFHLPDPSGRPDPNTGRNYDTWKTVFHIPHRGDMTWYHRRFCTGHSVETAPAVLQQCHSVIQWLRL